MSKESTAFPLREQKESIASDSQLVGEISLSSTSDLGTSQSPLNRISTASDLQQVATPPTPLNFVVAVSQNILLQLWEGVVTQVDADSFVATLRDKTNEENPDEEVTLPIAELADEDIELARPGAVFYWSVRYEQAPGLPRRRVSRIRFRRIPAWTKAELQRAKSVADRLRGAWQGHATESTRG